MDTQVIIVAGGKGKRMQSEIPKQFLLINNLPILMHTLRKFSKISEALFLVLPKDDIQIWRDLVKKYKFEVSVKIVEGGTERFHSVKNALEQCTDNGLILVHDGVRPLLSKTLIQNIVDTTKHYKACIPCLSVDDSMRVIQNNSSQIVDRNLYKLIQTPQGFDAKLLKEAYLQDYKSEFTDDASVVESLGQNIHLIEGEKQNIKITNPSDIKLAEFYLKK